LASGGVEPPRPTCPQAARGRLYQYEYEYEYEFEYGYDAMHPNFKFPFSNFTAFHPAGHRSLALTEP
jgi:hypothetical protein